MKTSIHQTKVDRERLLRLQKLYGARSMSETIRRAIDEALERRRILPIESLCERASAS